MDRSVFVGSIHWDSTRKLQPSERCGKAVSLTPTRSCSAVEMLEQQLAHGVFDHSVDRIVAQLRKEARLPGVKRSFRGSPGGGVRPDRAAPLPPPQIVSKILQRGSHAFIAKQGCAGFARCSGCWPHSLPADPGRIAPSIHSDLISGRDKGSIPVSLTIFKRQNVQKL
jgi:hypothetical protein